MNTLARRGHCVIFLSILATVLLGSVATLYGANQNVSVVIIQPSQPVEEQKVVQIVRDQILSPSSTTYLIAKVRVTFDNANNPQFLIVYLALSDISLSETARISLGQDYSVLAVERDYKQQENDIEPGFFDAHNVDMMFDTPVDFISSAVSGVNRACEIANQAGYSCDSLLGPQASIQAVRSYLLSNRIQAIGNIGHGNTGLIQLDDGDLTAAWFTSLPTTTLNGKVIYLNSCQVHNPPLENAVTGAGARTFIGGVVNLPIGGSEEVFKCFWQESLLNASEMGVALGSCEAAQGLTGFHGISGDTGAFASSRVTLDANQVSFSVDRSSQTTTTGLITQLVSIVGDSDSFHPGDLTDQLSPSVGNQSQNVQSILSFFVPGNGYHGTVNLDEDAKNDAVGFTHFLSVPPQSQITDATVQFGTKATGDIPGNDTILYNQSLFENKPPPGALPGYAPFIALHDLPEIANGVKKIDLSHVPVRLHNKGTASGDPDEYRDLRSLLTNEGRFDMVISDDTALDGSKLSATLVEPIESGGCLSGSAALFSFTATLQNLMPNGIDAIQIGIDSSTSSGVQLLLSNGQLLVPGDAVSLSQLAPTRISTLKQGESTLVPFKLCLSSLSRFNFFVTVTAVTRGNNIT